MRNKRLLVIVVALIGTLVLAGTALAASIDPLTRTVTSSALTVDFSETNPEFITDIRWNGSANLTNSAVVGSCADPLEYWGNSWITQDEGTPDFVFGSLVGWGTTGTWAAAKGNSVSIASASAGCPASLEIPIQTRYRFWDHGPVANRIRVERRFDFGATPLPYNVRGYIPRMYPLSDYTQVIHPNAAGTALVTEIAATCPFGCRVDNWDGTWFAVHSPTTGQGLIVRHAPSLVAVALWVDEDMASLTNAANVLLLAPAGGFTGTVVEVEFLCFYDSTVWTPSLTLPPGC